MVILKSCQNQSVAAQQTLCNFGEPSDKMFILLYGKLSIYSQEGAQVPRIEPVAPVGEMGLFTGEPRPATVKASEAATPFLLSKPHLDHLLRRNPGVEPVVSRNLIRTLSERLRAANQEITHLGHLIADQDAGTEELEEDPAAP